MNIRINKHKVFLLLLLFPFFPPDGLTTIGAEGFILNANFLHNKIILLSVNYLYWLRNLIGIFVIMFALISTLNHLKTTRFLKLSSPISMMFAIYAFWVIITTIINGGDIYHTLIMLIYCVGYLFILEREMKINPNQCINVLFLITQSLLFINLILMYIFPNGITNGLDYLNTPYYFLGSKNQITPFLVFSVMILYLHNEIKKKKGLLILRTLLIIANTVWMSSSTSIIAVFLMLIIFFVRMIITNKVLPRRIRGKSPHIFIGRVLIIMTVIIYIGIVFFNFQNAFSWLIVNILNKDISISGRTEIWRLAITQIKNRSLIGYGYGHMITGHYYAHNAILELLSTTGIIGGGLYINMIYKVVRSLIQKDSISNEFYKIIIIAAMIGIFVANIGEAFLYNISQFSIYIFAYYTFSLKLLFAKKDC